MIISRDLLGEKMRAVLLSLGSVLLTCSVIGNAYYQKKQFYPSVVYITKSNPSMAVMYIQAFVLVLLMGKLVRKVFFGQLRAAEMEHLIERSWYAVTETCLAFTVFRDDFSPKFVALFTLLLFLKCFHWLAEDRVDYMERSPIISWLFHIRVSSLLLLLGVLDYLFVSHAYHSTLTKGASVQLVFGFEYAILLITVKNIFIKYILHTYDLQSENPWENKAVFLLYSELVMGFCKVVLYLSFMIIMIKIHTFPLFAIRPMYLSMRAFKKAVNDVIMSRRAIRNMNTLYPDATAEELATVDNVCIICREEMTGNGSSKKLPCNHIFHASCLRSWFQRQQTCPTCRMDVLRVSSTAQATTQPPPQQPQPQPQVPPNLANWHAIVQGAFPAAIPFWFPPVPPPQGVPPQPQNLQQPAPPAAAPPHQPPSSPPSSSQSTPQPSQQQQQQQQSQPTSAQPGPSTRHVPSTPPPPPPQPSTTTAGGTPGTTSQSSTANAPLFMPPFPFMPFILPPPPPLPATDLSSLTVEELKLMEGQERENIEARIRCLQNIKTMLDGAMMHMQQYNAIVASLKNSANQNNATQATQTTINASSDRSENLSAVNGDEGRFSDGLSTNTAELESDRNSHLSGQDEIRRRRLQRFQQGGSSRGQENDQQ